MINQLSGQSCSGSDISSTTTISSNTTWNSASYTNADITVISGVELEISSTTIQFDGAKLILEPGAKLTITNSTLRPCPGNLLWPGIIAKGNDAIAQINGTSFNSSQTQVFVENSAIEYAEYGIWAGNTGCTGGSSYADIAPFECSGGAVVRCRNSNFLNCLRGVIFNTYSFDNYSYFVDCNFEWNDPEPWYNEWETYGDPQKSFWGAYEMVHLNEVKGISFLGGNTFINAVQFDDWDESLAHDNNHYLELGSSNENRGRGIFSRLSSFIVRRGGNCYDQPNDVSGTGGYECVGNVNTFEGFYAAISISEYQDIGEIDPISDNSIAITGTIFWDNSVAVFCYEKLLNLFINRCKVSNHAEYSTLGGNFLGFYRYFVKFRPQGFIVLSQIRNKCEISDNKVYFLEKDASSSWGRSTTVCDMEDWKVNFNDDPDRVSCIALRNIKNNNALDVRIYRNYVGMRNEDLNCPVIYSAIDIQAKFASLNLECNRFFVDFDRSTAPFYPRFDFMLYHGDDNKSGYNYNIPNIGSISFNSGNEFYRDHTVAPDCNFWNNPPYNGLGWGDPRKFVYFPTGNLLTGASFINAGSPTDVNYYRLMPNDITDPYCFTNPPSGNFNISDAPSNPCERSNPSNFHGESTPVPGMSIYLVTNISTTSIDVVNPTSELDDYPFEDGSATTYENENIAAFVVYDWNSIDENKNDQTEISNNLVSLDNLRNVTVKGLDNNDNYQMVVFNVKGQIFYQGKYIPETPVFGMVDKSIGTGIYYVGLSTTKGIVGTYKVLVVE